MYGKVNVIGEDDSFEVFEMKINSNKTYDVAYINSD